MPTTISRIVYSVDAMAKANGITSRHELDTLVGIATRALAEGQPEGAALETARNYAKRITRSNSAIDQLFADMANIHLLQQQAI